MIELLIAGSGPGPAAWGAGIGMVRCTCSPMGPTAAGGRHLQGCPLDTPEGKTETVQISWPGFVGSEIDDDVGFDMRAFLKLRNASSY